MPSLEIEIALDGDIVGSGVVDEIEIAEVTLPGAISLTGMVKNAGNAPALMVLGASDPIPPGTPAGTVILRQS